MDSANWTWRTGEENPLISPLRCWPSLQHSSVSPCQRGNSPPCIATKPRQLFKTGCLSEASFPSNKQSAKPDFGRQGGSTRVTLFPHPVSWSIGAPEGVWAARRWEGSGLRWKSEAMCQAAGGDEPRLLYSGVCGTEQGGSCLKLGRGTSSTCWCSCHSIRPYLSLSSAESVDCCDNEMSAQWEMNTVSTSQDRGAGWQVMA